MKLKCQNKKLQNILKCRKVGMVEGIYIKKLNYL